MTTEAEQTARGILRRLQDAIDARDHGALAGLFHEDAVLIGTSAHNVGRESVLAYLRAVVDQPAALRWDFTDLALFHADEDELGFAGFGEVVMSTAGDEVRAPFRLTVLATRASEGWRLKQFHGSIPATP